MTLVVRPVTWLIACSVRGLSVTNSSDSRMVRIRSGEKRFALEASFSNGVSTSSSTGASMVAASISCSASGSLGSAFRRFGRLATSARRSSLAAAPAPSPPGPSDAAPGAEL